MKHTILTASQVFACLVCAVCGLVPVIEKTATYWGALGASVNDAPPVLHEVTERSPADRDGLRVDDRVLTAAGSAPLNNPRFYEVLRNLKPGEAVVLRVRRTFRPDGKEMDVTIRGVEPEVAAIYYLNASLPVAGGLGLAIGLLIFATQPIRPSPTWRSILVLLAGLGIAVVFFLGLTVFGGFSVVLLRSYHAREILPTYSELKDAIGLASALALATFAAWELRARLSGDRATASRQAIAIS